MPGPPPKPVSQRRRTNSVAGIAKLPQDGRKGSAPKPKTGILLCSVALDYWETLWSSPMAVVYTDADVFPLSRLAVLVHERESEQSRAGDVEIRHLEDRFGVSPLARRKLNWEIDQAEQAQRPVAPAGSSVADRLRAVS